MSLRHSSPRRGESESESQRSAFFSSCHPIIPLAPSSLLASLGSLCPSAKAAKPLPCFHFLLLIHSRDRSAVSNLNKHFFWNQKKNSHYHFVIFLGIPSNETFLNYWFFLWCAKLINRDDFFAHSHCPSSLMVTSGYSTCASVLVVCSNCVCRAIMVIPH